MGRSAFSDDYDDFGGGAPSAGGSSRPQSRPQPAAFDTDLDDDVPFGGMQGPCLGGPSVLGLVAVSALELR